MSKAVIAALAAAGALAACSGGTGADNVSAPTETGTASTAPTSSVTREEVPAPVETPVAVPVAAAIQTQPGPNGYQVSLNKVAVTGDILTVSLSYAGGKCCAYARLDEVAVIDDATSQRIGVLKDNAGKWMASPMDSRGDRLAIGLGGSGDGPRQVWFKFPAPPATSRTISLTIPEVAPFDPVPVTR